MSSNLRERTRLAAVVLVSGALAAGCVQQKPAGVAIKALESSIVFGLKPKAEVVPPVVSPPIGDYLPPAVEPSSSASATSSSDLEPSPIVKRPTPPAPVAVDPCPPALASAFPKQSVTFDASKQPAEGAYRWKRIVETLLPDGSGGYERQTTFSSHDVTNITKPVESTNPVDGTTTRTFTFDDVEHYANGTSTVTYQVQSNGVQETVGTNVGQAATVGSPTRGIAISKIVTRGSTGSGTVNFTPPVLLLPLPVAVPQSFQSVGVDPVSGASLVVNGQVVGKDRVDACGTIIEGWKVTATETYTSATGATEVLDHTYLFGPHLGGLLLLHRVASTQAPTSGSITDQIGQLDPSPLQP